MGPSIFIFFFPAVIKCYPVSPNSELAIKPDNKEETLFPNGTVAGKYSYVDKEGNPVQVKYYADGANYGVELKSLKVIDRGLEKVHSSKLTKIEFSSQPSTGVSMSTDPDETKTQWPFELNFPVTSSKLKIPSDFFDSKKPLKTYFKDDYDLAPNIQYPQTNSVLNDKKGVHFKKPNRVVRKVLHKYKEPRMCKQY